MSLTKSSMTIQYEKDIRPLVCRLVMGGHNDLAREGIDLLLEIEGWQRVAPAEPSRGDFFGRALSWFRLATPLAPKGAP